MNYTTSRADVRRCMGDTLTKLVRLSLRHKREANERGVRLFDHCIDALAHDCEDGRTYPIADVLRRVR